MNGMDFARTATEELQPTRRRARRTPPIQWLAGLARWRVRDPAPFWSIVLADAATVQQISVCLQNLQSQMERSWELIVVVGQTDPDLEPGARRLIRSDRRIRVVRTSRTGLPAAINAGLIGARGHWRRWVKAGCTLGVNQLAEDRRMIVRHPGIAACWSGPTPSKARDDLTGGTITGDHQANVASLLTCADIQDATAFFHQHVFDVIGYLDERLSSAFLFDLALRSAVRLPAGSVVHRHRAADPVGRNAEWSNAREREVSHVASAHLDSIGPAELWQSVRPPDLTSALEIVGRILDLASDDSSVVYGAGVRPTLIIRLIQWVDTLALDDGLIEALRNAIRNRIRLEALGQHKGRCLTMWQDLALAVAAAPTEWTHEPCGTREFSSAARPAAPEVSPNARHPKSEESAVETRGVSVGAFSEPPRLAVILPFDLPADRRDRWLRAIREAAPDATLIVVDPSMSSVRWGPRDVFMPRPLGPPGTLAWLGHCHCAFISTLTDHPVGANRRFVVDFFDEPSVDPATLLPDHPEDDERIVSAETVRRRALSFLPPPNRAASDRFVAVHSLEGAEVPDVELIVDTCRQLIRDDVPFDMVFIGTGSGSKVLLEIADDDEIADCLHVMGPVDDILPVLRNSDALVLTPGNRDRLGIEAMLAGSIVIVVGFERTAFESGAVFVDPAPIYVAEAIHDLIAGDSRNSINHVASHI